MQYDGPGLQLRDKQGCNVLAGRADGYMSESGM